jgi:dynamin 1-like protein
MLQLLNDCLKPTNEMVKNLVKVQDAYINTYHPDFMGGANSIFNMFDPQEQTNKANQVAKQRMNIEKLD